MSLVSRSISLSTHKPLSSSHHSLVSVTRKPITNFSQHRNKSQLNSQSARVTCQQPHLNKSSRTTLKSLNMICEPQQDFFSRGSRWDEEKANCVWAVCEIVPKSPMEIHADTFFFVFLRFPTGIIFNGLFCTFFLLFHLNGNGPFVTRATTDEELFDLHLLLYNAREFSSHSAILPFYRVLLFNFNKHCCRNSSYFAFDNHWRWKSMSFQKSKVFESSCSIYFRNLSSAMKSRWHEMFMFSISRQM